MGDDDFSYESGNDDPKKQWQEEQLARDAAFEKQALKDEKARIRRARRAQRQLKKVRDQLRTLGEITDWEDEFILSVDERLDQYDAAFRDRTKGGAADALSMRQKQVLSQMRRKVKDKGKQNPDSRGKSGDPHSSERQHSTFKPRSSFKSKSNYKPRVRHIEDDMIEDDMRESDTREGDRLQNDKTQNDSTQKTPPEHMAPIKRKPVLSIIKGGKQD